MDWQMPPANSCSHLLPRPIHEKRVLLLGAGLGPYVSMATVQKIETKAVKKDHHKEQQAVQGAFRDRVEALGHTCITVRSLDDVLAVL